MLSRPAASVIVVATLVGCAMPPAARQRLFGEITLEQARTILGANPVAIPGHPAKFFPHGRYAILVRQELDSGRVIAFREDRNGRWTAIRVHGAGEDGVESFTSGGITAAEAFFWTRAAYREVDGVSVRYLGRILWPIPHDLLDRLEPIP